MTGSKTTRVSSILLKRRAILALANIPVIAEKYAEPTGIKKEYIQEYLEQNMHYYMDQSCIEGLVLFYEKAADRRDKRFSKPGICMRISTPFWNPLREGRRISSDEAIRLFDEADLLDLAGAADRIRTRLHPDNVISYIIDRNINYTNVCKEFCTFCAFYRVKGDREAYVLPDHVIHKKIEETLALAERES